MVGHRLVIFFLCFTPQHRPLIIVAGCKAAVMQISSRQFHSFTEATVFVLAKVEMATT